MDQTDRPSSGDREPAPAQGRVSTDDEDASLIRATARQDRRAFEMLYRRYASRLGGYLYKYLRSQDLVEEAFNDVMVVVWRNAARFDGRAKVSTWLFGIAHNKALKTLERVRRHRGVDSFEDEATPDLDQLESPDGASNPERQASLGDMSAALDVALRALSAEQRGVVELTFNEGFSYAEIAEITGVPVNTVKTRMFHARKRLAEALAELDAPSEGQRS
ncbi:MAG: RNA polymerase sigma factor [Gammaproteobacteria bacterium]